MSESQGPDEEYAAARLAALIGAEEWATVLQGVELARSIGPDALRRLTEGVSVGADGRLVQSQAWLKASGVQAVNRDNAALLAVSLQDACPLASAEILDLSGMEGLTDLRPLETSGSLKELRLNGSGVSDLTPLSCLAGLRRLSVTGRARPSSLPAFPKGAALERLVVENLDSADLAPIGALTNLKSLAIIESSVNDVSGLAGCSSLERLRLWRCSNLSDLEPLAKLGRLGQLALGGLAPGVSLSPLSVLVDLEELQLVELKGIDLSPLANLAQLRSLDLSDSVVRSVESLRGLVGLSSLTLPLAESYDDGNFASYADDVWAFLGLPGRARPDFEGSDTRLALQAMIVVALLLDSKGTDHWPDIEGSLRSLLESADPRLMHRLGKGLSRSAASPATGAITTNGSPFMTFSPISRLFGKRKRTPSWADELSSLLQEFISAEGASQSHSESR